MNQYRTVIFDLDGTLLNTLDDLTDSVNFAMAELGLPSRSSAEIRSFVGNGVRRLMELAVPGGSQNPRFQAALNLFTAHYSQNCRNKTAPYPGVMALLRSLSAAGYKLAIVSNKL